MWYQKVTDATVAAVSANCPELTTLCLSKCDSITDEALTMLSQGCPILTLVYIYTVGQKKLHHFIFAITLSKHFAVK